MSRVGDARMIAPIAGCDCTASDSSGCLVGVSARRLPGRATVTAAAAPLTAGEGCGNDGGKAAVFFVPFAGCSFLAEPRVGASAARMQRRKEEAVGGATGWGNDARRRERADESPPASACPLTRCRPILLAAASSLQHPRSPVQTLVHTFHLTVINSSASGSRAPIAMGDESGKAEATLPKCQPPAKSRGKGSSAAQMCQASHSLSVNSLRPSPNSTSAVTLSRLIAAALPSDFTCSEGARELIHDCCKEFVQLLASEANEMTNSSEGGRGRINATHLVDALKELGYERYLPDVDEIVEGEKADAKVRA